MRASILIFVAFLLLISLYVLSGRLDSNRPNGTAIARSATEIVPVSSRTSADLISSARQRGDDGPIPDGLSPREDPAHPDYFGLNMAGLHSGRLKREDVGPGYEEFIRRIARKNFDNNLDAGLNARAAAMCGVDDWAQVEADLTSQEPLLIATRPHLQRLADLAQEASSDIKAYAALTWDMPSRMEVYDPAQPHDTADWVALNYSPDVKESLHSFVGTTRAGDRVFQMHFFSRDHPALEQKLETLRALKEEYWRVRRAGQ